MDFKQMAVFLSLQLVYTIYRCLIICQFTYQFHVHQILMLTYFFTMYKLYIQIGFSPILLYSLLQHTADKHLTVQWPNNPRNSSHEYSTVHISPGFLDVRPLTIQSSQRAFINFSRLAGLATASIKICFSMIYPWYG